jgi:hypothetical protein
MIMAKRIDISGHTFNKLTVTRYAYTKNKKAYWWCKCSCGKEIIVESYPLRHNERISCGCEVYKGLDKGYSHKPLYNLWWNIKRRCNDSTIPSYKNYGGRGISICKEWMDYSEFYKWSLNNGYRRGLTIDRIDVNGNYEPSNCRWVDWKTQERNRSNNHLLTYNDETHCISEWSEITGINKRTIRGRLLRGWSVKDALTIGPDERSANGR